MLDNMLDKLKKNSATIGGLIGFISTPNRAESDPPGMERIWNSLNQALQGNIHLPDFEKVGYEMRSDANTKAAVVGYVGAEVVKAFGVPIVGSWMPALQRALVAFLGGSLAQTVLVRATNHPNGQTYSVPAPMNGGYDY